MLNVNIIIGRYISDKGVLIIIWKTQCVSANTIQLVERGVGESFALP